MTTTNARTAAQIGGLNMTKVTPIPTNLVEFVTRFPGLTASGISQLRGKTVGSISGSLYKLVKDGRLAKRRERGMTMDGAWRYYPPGHRNAACPVCRDLSKQLAALEAELAQYKQVIE